MNILGSGLTFNAYGSQWEEGKTASINNKSEMVELCERKCINRIIKLLLVQNRILVPSIMNFFLIVQNRKSDER